MKLLGTFKNITKNIISNTYLLTFETNQEPNRDELLKIADKLLEIEAKQKRNRRSLDANAYSWVLIGKIAEEIGVSKDEVYLMMLERYSNKFEPILVPKNSNFTQYYRLCVEIGEQEIDNIIYTQYLAYRGSSEFNTKEMSVFIDGIVSEAKELGVETIPPTEIERLLSLWEKG